MKVLKRFSVRFIINFFFSSVLFFMLTGTTLAGNGNAGYVADELLVQSKPGVSKARITGILRGMSADAVGEIASLRVKRIKVPAHALENVKSALANNPNISFVENNFIAETALVPNDQQFPSQWHLMNISAPLGWDISTGSNSVPIAIIDSGVNQSHSDLSGKIIPGYNFLNESTRTNDKLGHGTKVAGAAAAVSNNGIGVASVAWGNPIMPLVVLNNKNWATYYDISRAITYAADNGVKVMNISIAGSSFSYTLQNAVDYAWGNGGVIIAAAGNSATSAPYYPAACNNVVAVSATDSGDSSAYFSNFGNWIDISAPGVSILTTSKDGGYSLVSGTSFSSPITAGLAALIMSANPNLTNLEVVEILKQNTDDLGDPGFDDYFGHGKINIYNSLIAAGGAIPDPDTTEPAASITSPADGSTVSGYISVNVSATDNIGVSDVELYINGTLFDTDTTEPYSFLWHTEDYPDGAYELTAIAYDFSGNTGQSDYITVYTINPTQADTIAPDVSIISPANNSSVKRNTLIKAAASDNVGVVRVEFYVDTVPKKIINEAKDVYSWKWNTRNASNGEHSIMVKAFDGAGNVGTDYISVYK